MIESTESLLSGSSSAGRLLDWSLPPTAAATLARVARTRAPILCLACYGPAFARVAAAIHGESQRDRLILVDLRSARDAILTGLIRATTSPRATIAIDGVELLDRDTQAALVRTMERDSPRLVSATALALDDLRDACRPEFFALVSTVTVRTPAIAERASEIGELAERRLEELALDVGRAVPALAPSAIAALAAHSWPGDALELDALLLRTLLVVDADRIEARHLRWHPDVTVPFEDEPPNGRAAVAAGSACAGDETARRAAYGAEPAPHANGSQQLANEASVEASEAIAVELAHQLKNPLVTVKTFVQNVAQLSNDPADLARFRDLTDEAITRMDEALEGLLAFARLGPPRSATVEVVELLREALREAWASFAAKDITVTGPNGAALEVVGDPDHLRIALATLARYLLEAIEPRTALAVTIDPDGEVRLSYRESGAATHLRGITGLTGGSFPLALLLVRGALARLGSGLEVSHHEGVVEVALRFATG